MVAADASADPTAVEAPTVEEFADGARSWLAGHRRHAPPDYGAICPPELIDDGIAWQRRLLDAGYAGIHWPVDHGGRGLGVEHHGAWLVECARAGVPPVLNMVGLVLAGGAVLAHGTPGQQARHLRATLAAEHVWCQLFSEPGAGSDLAGLSTTAEVDGDHVVVNGSKVWCSGGRVSSWGILMARTDPRAPRHRGISCLLCPMDRPGIEVRPLRQMTGGSEFDEVFLTDVVLPLDHLLGPLHGGWSVAMGVLAAERGHIGTAVVALERRLEQFRELGRRRPLDAAARRRLVELLATASAYRSLAARGAPGPLLKLGITETMFDVAMLRAATAGADALVDGEDAAGVLAAPGGRIAGGTSQIQRTIIGERLLGLPREPSPD